MKSGSGSNLSISVVLYSGVMLGKTPNAGTTGGVDRFSLHIAHQVFTQHITCNIQIDQYRTDGSN